MAEKADEDSAPDKPGKPEQTDQADKADHGRDEQGDWIKYDSLNLLEKESLSSHINRAIAGRTDALYNDLCGCFGFCGWMREQFDIDAGTSTPPTVFFSTIEFLRDQMDESGQELFGGRGDEDYLETYYRAIRMDIEIDYGASDLDKEALGQALLRYTTKHIGFFSTEIYRRLRGAYGGGEGDGRYITERLPFAVLNRDVLVEIVGLFAERPESENEGARRAWARAVMKEGTGKADDSFDESKKTEAFNDLVRADYERVPLVFFGDQR